MQMVSSGGSRLVQNFWYFIEKIWKLSGDMWAKVAFSAED